MLYRICATVVWDSNKDKKCEKLLCEYPCLKDFGWRLVEYVDVSYTRIQDENGELISMHTPKIFHRPYIEINSLEELQKLQVAVQNPLIFTEDAIEIYDGYRE